MPGEADAAQGSGGRSGGDAGGQAGGFRQVRRGEGAGDGGVAVQDPGGVRRVCGARADGSAAGEDDTEDIGQGDGVRGGGAGGAVLSVGEVPEGRGQRGGVDPAVAIGAERLYGQGQEEGAAAVEATEGFVASGFYWQFR